MRWSKAIKSFKRALLAAGLGMSLGAAAHADIIVSEVAPWSSGNSPLGVDWFELTNNGVAAVNIAGWAVDDNSADFASARALAGITSIGAGESVIFMETADLAGKSTEFKTLWFGGSAPAGLKLGNYTGSGIGLGSGGDELHIFNGSGVVQTRVAFGGSPLVAPFTTFDNKTGFSGLVPPISTFSAVGVRGAFAAANDTNEIGSPGTFVQVPEPASAGLVLVGLAFCGLATANRRRK